MAHLNTSVGAEKSQYLGGERVGVLLPLPLAGVYDYRVPKRLAVAPGDFVRVPLGGRSAFGVVWGDGAGEVSEARLKEVSARLEAPPLPEVSRRFIEWVAAYTLSPLGAVLRMALGVPEALEPEKAETAYAPVARPEALRLTPARRRVLAALDSAKRPLLATELARQARASPSVVKGLLRAGAIAAVAVARRWAAAEPDGGRPGPPLSAPQAAAAAALEASVRAGRFAVAVLDGVPGAGKTEVYFQAVAEALRRGRQVLVLLPEIALGPQWTERFRRRFGAEPVAWHSDVPRSRRRLAWRAVAGGQARAVVGARSALFLPFPELGLIVVDEEHDPAFKQEEQVVYHARDMAVVRASLGGVPIALVSATPSLETVANAAAGRYARLHLPARHAGAELPRVAVIDMRAEKVPAGRWLSPVLRAALAETLAAGEQALLFLNRRGYAPLTLCRACGHRIRCPRCSAWLVEHRLVGRLACHHCGHAAPRPGGCPACGARGLLAACGPGVERLAEEAANEFPRARQLVAASDTIAGPDAAEALVRRIEEHEVDLVIGTQIVAKGHHFPLLTLVGVVDADLGLSGGDLRAAERTYQLLYQVAGRAGRAERPGRVLLQTYVPEHPVMRALAAADRERFVAAETAARREAGMPPFGRLAALILSGTDEKAVDEAAAVLARASPKQDGVRVLGPAPAPLALLRGRHRRRFLLRTDRGVPVQPLIKAWLEAAPPPRKVRVQVDVDPQSFL
jgi:primosomal protein N' (replication factor Y)